MSGLHFEVQAPIVRSDPNRADIACFVGFVKQREREVPPSVNQREQEDPSSVNRWLKERGWVQRDESSDRIQQLLDVPVPIDSWDVFDRLFAWEHRVINDRGQLGTSYLGAALRSFFAQGGRKCYVVRVGDPWPFNEKTGTREERIIDRLSVLIPGYPGPLSSSPVDQASWHGIGHLFGLPDVSCLCMPDLADAVAIDHASIKPPEPRPSPDEQFVECSDPPAPPIPDNQARLLHAPRCDETGYTEWAKALGIAADFLARNQREVQLVAALPIPEPGTAASQDILKFLTDGGRGPLAISLNQQSDSLSSAFVQLAYPWVRSPGSTNLPAQLESPDAVLAGILARNALMRGAFRSAANLHVADVYDVHPALPREHMLNRVTANPSVSNASHTILERVSLFGPTPNGLKLLSDVTTSLNESYRPASVNRLVSIIVRAARKLGEDRVFESSNEALWTDIKENLNNLLLNLLQAGALRSRTPAEAFHVRCDRSTMTQNDIDSGRVIAHVQFTPSGPIEQITVILAMHEGGQVSLGATGRLDKEAA